MTSTITPGSQTLPDAPESAPSTKTGLKRVAAVVGIVAAFFVGMAAGTGSSGSAPSATPAPTVTKTVQSGIAPNDLGVCTAAMARADAIIKAEAQALIIAGDALQDPASASQSQIDKMTAIKAQIGKDMAAYLQNKDKCNALRAS